MLNLEKLIFFKLHINTFLLGCGGEMQNLTSFDLKFDKFDLIKLNLSLVAKTNLFNLHFYFPYSNDRFWH